MKRLEQILNIITGNITKAELLLSEVLLAIIMVLLLVLVINRYLIHSTIIWGNQAVTVLFNWLCMSGISYVYQDRGHISVEFVADRLIYRHRKILNIIIYLVILISLIFISYYSIVLLPVHARRVIVGLGLPRTLLSVPILIWGLSMGIKTLNFFVREINNTDNLTEGEGV